MRARSSLLLAGIVFIPLALGVVSPGLAEQLRTVVMVAADPLLETQARLARVAKSGLLFLIELPSFQKKSERLERELQVLKGELISLSELKQENERLTGLLQLKGKSSFSSIAARLIGRDPSHWSQFVVINKGVKDGVRTDTVLIHPQGLVGKIVAAGPHVARGILLTDRQSRVSALNERTRDIGMIEGTGGATLKMTYLDYHSKIQVGDVIVSSGIGGIYPKGIPIGRIQLVGEEKNQLALYAVVEPFVSFSKLEEILCISSS